MTMPSKLLTCLPFVALLAACNATAGGDPVNTQSELEATLDQDIDGDGTVPQGGTEVGVDG